MRYLLLEVSEEATQTVATVSIIAMAVLAVVLFVLCCAKKNKNFDTKSIAYGALCLSMSFALSFIKVSPVTYGGSITLASMLPVLLYAYCNGVGKGLLVGVLFGLLNFVQSPYILTPFTFLFDFVFAYGSIAIIGLFGKLPKRRLYLLLGIGAVYLVRFAMHFVSGLIYFSLDAIWAELPKDSGFVYSFLYNITYLAPDAAIVLTLCAALYQTSGFQMILKQLTPVKEVPAE